jgi:transposase
LTDAGRDEERRTPIHTTDRRRTPPTADPGGDDPGHRDRGGAILEDDTKAPRKQRHTARRIFERLRDEHGYAGGLTIVKQAVAAWRTRSAEVFVPLAHPPGEAQVDFGTAEVLLDGQPTIVALFVMTLPYSDAIFGGRGGAPGLPAEARDREGVHREG